ncbi:WD40 repeat-like protein [Dissoconium aciculare CBS 342.82]|uniref:WD40 repeat-like protein n=1 Tax=Dissoconium aciculare CBS 342.82 TaxID=1314786 RepID=A0A6J3MJ57_9PEZI|nr:WD40 repeat-like protein [Dissoconium aciculare CBS 342.82]KAF1827915.1 WD40 repeat-like protein [Dissoconium aciculare CBS 342.82]
MQHENYRVPVTALAYWSDDVLLVGQGTHLRAYDTRTQARLCDHSVFATQAIHGISIHHGSSNPIILVRGGQLITILIASRLPTGEFSVEQSAVYQSPDWVLDATFSPAINGCTARAALVTAHNALTICDLSCEPLCARLDIAIPGSNCILYSANITWLDDSKCLIASGTAFGDVIVWSCAVSASGEELSAASQTHYVFSAHQGSVFGVTISSPEIAASFGGRSRVLASCSDDRTVRLWDISDLTVKSPTLLELQRQTGFGTEDAKDANGPQCLSSVMGHISRIWHVRFVQYSPSVTKDGAAPLNKAVVLSFGEDASCIAWSAEPGVNSVDHPFRLTQMSVVKAHAGKSIWSVGMSPRMDVATGGADGAVAIFPSSRITNGNPLQIIDRTLIDQGSQGDNFKSYAFLDESLLLATTEHGGIALLSQKSDSTTTHKTFDALPGLRGFSIVVSISGLAFFAGIDGKVYSYSEELSTVTEIADTGRKVADMFVGSNRNDAQPELSSNLTVLVTNVGSTTAHIIHANQAIDVITIGAASTHAQSKLELPTGFMVTSFACKAWTNNLTVIAVGSRSGAVAIYCFDSSHQNVSIPTLFAGIHSKEAVTSLIFHVSSATSSNGSLSLLSTGRDGTYACQRLTVEKDTCQLKCIHQLSLPFGPNIERLEVQESGHLWAWGFRSKQFVVYDITSQREIMTVECGGAHRNWTFRSGAHGGEFVWTKASKLYYTHQDSLPFEHVAVGGHGREIKCMSISTGSPPIIATGAEDTNIKLSIYQNERFDGLLTLQKHNTGVQHLQWSPDNRFLFSSGGFEEFCIWRISYNAPILGIGVVCESTHPNHGTSDLRIMNFDVEMLPSQSSEAETFVITMAYSNSNLIQWRYTDKTWSLVAEGSYLTSCLTQCLHFGARNTLLTASTDGHIALWTKHLRSSNETKLPTSHGQISPSSLEWTVRHPVHQSAILAAAHYTLRTSPPVNLLLTGGDDNAIGITRLPSLSAADQSTTTISTREAPITLLLTRAHAAAVTAVAFLGSRPSTPTSPSPPHEGNLAHVRFASTGLDQRVKLWEILIDPEIPGIDCVRSVRRILSPNHKEETGGGSFTPVADISGVCVFQIDDARGGADGAGGLGGAICISGVGMDIWKIAPVGEEEAEGS